ncbi:phage tail protein [Pseudomonas syringae]|uniref:phage tail-collar fiber domain-containing protein n=1 Tax=Pseudomonas syringae TaxID=317 RepID=UPI0003F793BA|nr:phage tail protein [Pseudomonas syringae]
MGASITVAGESLIAQKHVAQQGLKVSRFIFANVPGLDPSSAVDRAAPKPAAANIVYSYQIPDDNAGYVNSNQVVYSAQIGSDIGDWDFNWIGLETAEGVLFAVSYVPIQQKRRNIPPLQVGNNITRNFLVVFDGAQALTGITIDANTWQHDFTVRLAGIDERERQSNREMFGRACFFGTALQMEKVGSAYQLKPGTAYVEGIRLVRSAALPVVPTGFPTTAWLDVCLQRELNDVVATWKVVFAADCPDYADSLGVRHYCVPIADLTSSTITDRRTVEPIDAVLVQYFASRAFVRDEINKLDNKQSAVVATTAPVELSGSQRIDGVVAAYGERVLVKDQAAAAQNGLYVVSPGNWARAADADASLEVTPGMLIPIEKGTVNGDSLWQLVTDGPIVLGTTALTFEMASGPTGLAAGTYRSVTVDKRGHVIGGTNPSTLAGIGVTDALTKAETKSLLPFRGQVAFTVPGVYSWVVPNDVSRAYITVIGAGGGGRNSSLYGGGGGGGGVAEGLISPNPGETVSITVGAGGFGATYSVSDGVGGNGGSSAFGAYMSATGGSSGTTNGQGGFSGIGSGGDINYGLGDGHAGARTSTSVLGVAGAGGGPGGAGVPVSATGAANGVLRIGRGPGGGGGGRMDNGGKAADGAAGAVIIRY